ncbi:hypothetical protein M406DRAFT_104562 [Cryphonectria parasitica EP155]|uniref:Uncharacterized protein n=1 Tax=Cryphonectria parasitica (strain ATCC 38755 / EP155) TaxID=660469 RepID=A0A9P4XS08_CRYP1|nr:uncharacterized protein M406DRAFT_104562 [Cryphonectria parasitica EP155]KAF3759974.1 hypothetical protein M406DRAFT_104562 [Cryphonectria parasitica EP155]
MGDGKQCSYHYSRKDRQAHGQKGLLFYSGVTISSRQMTMTRQHGEGEEEEKKSCFGPLRDTDSDSDR